MAQTSYAEQSAGYAGMKADSVDDTVGSYVQGEASAEIPFGVMVAQSTAGTNGTPDKIVKLVDATSVLAGILLHSHEYADNELGTTGLKPKALSNILRKGRAWVNVEQAVGPTDPVYVRHTASGSEVKGQFRKDADTSDAVLVYGAKFIGSTSAAGLVVVEIDMNAHAAGLAAQVYADSL